MLGTILQERYFIYEKISHSSLSEIYLARDMSLGKIRIVKKYLSLSSSEIQYYRLLSHPMLPQCIDFFSAYPYTYLVLEYIPGSTLQKLYDEKGAFSEPFLLYLAFACSSFFSYLHKQKPPIFYCDCKPSNFIFSSFGKFYAIDLGSAIQNTCSPSKIFSTKEFAAPELSLGILSPASDVYSLGKTLLYLSGASYPISCQDKIFPDFWNLLSLCLKENLAERLSSPLLFHTKLLEMFPHLQDPFLSHLFPFS